MSKREIVKGFVPLFSEAVVIKFIVSYEFIRMKQLWLNERVLSKASLS